MSSSCPEYAEDKTTENENVPNKQTERSEVKGECYFSVFTFNFSVYLPGRRKECGGRGCRYTEGVRKTRQEPSAAPRSM